MSIAMMSEHGVDTDKISVNLPNGSSIKFEASFSGKEDVAFNDGFELSDINNALLGITEALKETIQKIEPQKATIKFGVEIAVESGNLTAVIVKGASKANLEITLEWEKQVQNAK